MANYKGLQVFDSPPIGSGGQLIDSNYRAIVDGEAEIGGTSSLTFELSSNGEQPISLVAQNGELMVMDDQQITYQPISVGGLNARGGNVTNAGTISANYFYGNGSGIFNICLLNGNNTFTGTNTFNGDLFTNPVVQTPYVGDDIIYLSATDIWDDPSTPSGSKLNDNGHLKTWWDRGGHQISPTNSTVANQPYYYSNIYGNEAGVLFVNSSGTFLSTSFTPISISSGITVIAEFMTRNMASEGDYRGVMSSAACNMIHQTHTDDITTTGNAVSYVSADWYSGLVFANSYGFIPLDRPSIQVSRLGGGMDALTRINGHTHTATQTTSSSGVTMSDITLGSWAGNYYLDGYAFRYRVLPYAASLNEISLIEKDLCKKKKYSLPSLLICSGDSITAGYKGTLSNLICTPADIGSVSGKTYPGFLRTARLSSFLTNWEVSNIGVIGYTFEDMTNDLQSKILDHGNTNRGYQIVLIIAPISNEYSLIGATSGHTAGDAQLIYDRTVAYCIALRNAGFKVGLMSQPKCFDTNPAAMIDQVRALYAANHSFVDEYHDLSADPRLHATSTSLTTYFVEGLHPTDIGDQIIATHAADLVRRITGT